MFHFQRGIHIWPTEFTNETHFMYSINSAFSNLVEGISALSLILRQGTSGHDNALSHEVFNLQEKLLTRNPRIKQCVELILSNFQKCMDVNAKKIVGGSNLKASGAVWCAIGLLRLMQCQEDIAELQGFDPSEVAQVLSMHG